MPYLKLDIYTMKQLAACLVVMALTPVGFAQTTIYWTGNENRWGGGSLTPTADDNFATNSGTWTSYQKVSANEIYHHVYNQNVMAGANSTVSMNRANNTLASVTLYGSSPATGFVFDTVGANSDGLKLAGNVSVNSGAHVFNNASNNLATLTANTTWNVTNGAKLTWRLPLTESITGLTLTKSGAGTLLLGGNITVGSTGTLLVSAGAFGGSATLAGNLAFAAGSKLQFSATDTLTIVAGRQASFSGPFGVAELAGLDSAAALGNYQLISGTVDFQNFTNVGPAGAVLLGAGKRAYFENSAGLRLRIVADFPGWPRPTLRWFGFDQARPVLSLEGVAPAGYLIQNSTNLAGWTDAGYLLATSSPAFWTNPASVSDPQNFYRALMSSAPPAQAANPSPANLAVGVSTTTDLNWTAGAGAASYDVYFGTTSPGVFMGNQAATNFDPGTLNTNTTYYWRIDEKNAPGTITGTVWSFTTAAQSAGVTYVGAGSVASGTGPITPGLPAGLLPGDLLVLFLETAADNTAVANGDSNLNPTNNGGTWLSVARNAASPQATGTGTSEVHLTAYYSRYNGTQGPPTTTDSGDHQLARIVAFRGVVAAGVPWDVMAGGTEALSDTSGSVPSAVTTVSNTLIVVAMATALPDANGTGNFSGWSNSGGMANLTERTDDSTSAGNGGALGIATADFAPAGTPYGNVNVTLATASLKAMMSVALKPETPPAQITNAWPAHAASNVGINAELRWTAGNRAASHDVYFGTISPGAFQGNQTATTFDPGALNPNTTYYWRVDEKNAAGTTAGLVRSFTTSPTGVLPQLVGATFNNATQELASAGCVVGNITRQFSDTVPGGVILTQSPVAGSACLPGTVVDLVRSRGPESGVVVFPNGRDFLNGEAIPVHRNVSLVTTHAGTILAMAGHRVNGADDEDDMDIHLRRSTDGGETWGPVIVLANDSMNPCKNYVPVVLPSGRILMLWLWNAWIPTEADRTTREVYATYSDDDGLTWSAHSNITSQVYQPTWDWYGLGPGHGFVKTRSPNLGIIIFPARHGVVGGTGKPHIIYTDDNGATFHLGGELSQGNESTACEQSDGGVLFNVRAVVLYRWAGVSADGGLTFPTQYEDTQLPGADKCQASLLEHSMNPVTGKANILFSNPEDLFERVNGTVKLSEQDGDQGTWVKKFRYSAPSPAFSGYSDLTVINPAGDVGLLWEFGSHYSKPARWDGGVKFRAITFSQINQPVP